MTDWNDMLPSMFPLTHHCLKTLFWEKEKGLTFIVDQSSCALSAQELVCRYVYTACTEASSLAGGFCDALQPAALFTLEGA